MDKLKNIYKNKLARIGGLVFSAVVIMYTLIYFDVVSRAKEAYQEGEKYSQWHENPQLKKQMLENQFLQEKQKLGRRLRPALADKLFGVRQINQEEYDRLIAALRFDTDRQMGESSLKYAYVWYQTVVELFTPPESKWVKLARQKMPVAKEKWKAELRSKGIKFEDYMID